MEPQSKEKVITFATSEHYQGAVELLKECRTKITTIVADDDFHTLINALTLEVEANLIQRFVIEVDNIRTGKNLNG